MPQTYLIITPPGTDPELSFPPGARFNRNEIIENAKYLVGFMFSFQGRYYEIAQGAKFGALVECKNPPAWALPPAPPAPCSHRSIAKPMREVELSRGY